MADNVALEIRNWSVGYLDHPIVRDFSAVFNAGSVTSLIGGNGAGKSTLLKSIFGLNRQFGGTLIFEGKAVDGLSPSSRLKAGIGIVPQGRCNFPQMTVRENLEMGTYLLPRAKASAAIERVVDIFPMLRRKWRQLAGNLSGGEQQVLETAMVLETGPRLLLLDEPSLGLSPKMQAEVFETVKAIRDDGVTVIMAEQNVFGSLMISDRAIVLELGKKFADGPANEIMHDPRIKAAFLGGDPVVEND
ncbi:ABC transporter ATP-binding protein [Mesorhizobium sp. M0013]|uniref:ABC transporter ATP-binding protein n=1 Tax=Mesorhizobium sp. M0013 TaxID=2956841 RepID=UPI00333D741B